ncbi:MAG: prephenate dehydratase [Actinomycetota bacterium]|nr:MAG: prephenate dehydratase [Actinomycetota bacterium]
MTAYAYLGPAGTFSEAALRAVPQAAGARFVPCATVTTALQEVRAGRVVAAMVPIENSVEGPVSTTQDELAQGAPVVIIAEWALPVRFALMARPGTTLADVRGVATHPHALAQCRGWLAENLPEALAIPAASTAAAAAALAAGDHPGFEAAIADPLAASTYQLDTLADGIGDNDEAWTRFVLVAQPGELPPATGADKTTLVLFMREDHPGALLAILTEFAVRGVNLTRIESRPTRKALGDYYFSVDCEGHIDDARVGEALMGLRRVCAEVRFLGSYARHDGKEPLLRHGVTDDDYTDAAAWLSRIRAGNHRRG